MSRGREQIPDDAIAKPGSSFTSYSRAERPRLEVIPGGKTSDGRMGAPIRGSTSPFSKTAPPTLAPHQHINERFRIIRFIATGGMGEVYEAEDLEVQDKIAIKIIRPEIADDRDAIERFRREIHLARRVTHPNVCRIFDLSRGYVTQPDSGNQKGAISFLTMELLAGETLLERVRRLGPLQSAEALPIISQMVAGLAAAHRAGVIHRDFKSSNVILVGSDHRLRAVVTDFGLARPHDRDPSSLTGTSELLGTPAYMAPEQVEGGQITPATDIYALGVVLYEITTGELPFAGEDRVSIALQRLYKPAPSPRFLAPHLDHAWERVILRCLERKPSDRFGRAEEVVKALGGDVLNRRLGKYEVLSREERPVKGELYTGWDLSAETLVDLQILPNVGWRSSTLEELERARGVSHPRLCGLLEIAQQESAQFLVLEHLDGDLLSTRLLNGPLALREALTCSTQVVDALTEIHGNGMAHGDLRPANIMFTKSGIKVLQFGLAQLEAPASQGEETAAYRSPAYLAGEKRDQSADLFAFGAILYEMLTGRKAFPSGTQTGAACPDPPLLASSQPLIPKRLKQLIRECLAPTANAKHATAEATKAELEAIFRTETFKHRHAGSWWLKFSKAITIALAGIIVMLLLYMRATPATRVPLLTSVIPPPENSMFSFTGPEAGPIAISPDGKRLAFSIWSGSKRSLWIRELDTMTPREINDTSGASFPFWSPDNRTVGFFADHRLKKVNVDGGAVATICAADLALGGGGTINRNGTVLFGTIAGPIYRIQDLGDKPAKATELGSDEGSHRWPFFLPDGIRFLYLAAKPSSGQQSRYGSVYVGVLDSSERKLLPIRSDSNVIYSSRHLLFMQEGTLMAQPFDLRKLEVYGSPVPIAQRVVYETRIWRGIFTASNDGMLVFQSGVRDNNSQLLLFNRQGKQTRALTNDRLDFFSARFSKNGKKIVTDIFDPQSRARHLWIYDVPTGVGSRITFDSLRHEYPVWSPDNRHIIFSHVDPQGSRDLHIQSFDDSARGERLFFKGSAQEKPTDWSPDGQFVAFDSWVRGHSGSQAFILPLTGDRIPVPVERGDWTTKAAMFSPDGRWLAYVSNKTGIDEVYIISFPHRRHLTQVSFGGGDAPRWNSKQNAILYIAPDKSLIATRLSLSRNGVNVVERRPLFATKTKFTYSYDISPNGSVLINTLEPSASPPVVLITDWKRQLEASHELSFLR
jgi:eukaryotic-like serine/threonine-protein kinase